MTPRQKQAKFRANLKEFAIDLLVALAFMTYISIFLYVGITM